MNKRHFEHMAAIVRAIRDGEWTHIAPVWASALPYAELAPFPDQHLANAELANYTRAIQTAEAFIVLSQEWNPSFDRKQFLIACGLAWRYGEAPIKRPRKARTA